MQGVAFRVNPNARFTACNNHGFSFSCSCWALALSELILCCGVRFPPSPHRSWGWCCRLLCLFSALSFCFSMSFSIPVPLLAFPVLCFSFSSLSSYFPAVLILGQGKALTTASTHSTILTFSKDSLLINGAESIVYLYRNFCILTFPVSIPILLHKISYSGL